MDPFRLSSLMCSRLCHDLVSPVGAINNGLEIMAMEDDPAMIKDVQSLLTDSAAKASSQLQFFRMAFGAGSGMGKDIPLSEAEVATRTLYESGKLTVEWDGPSEAMPKDWVKALMNVILLVGDANVRTGALAVKVSQHNKTMNAEVSATGEKVLTQDAIIAALDGSASEDDIDAKSVPGYLAALITKTVGGQLSVEYVPNELFKVAMSIPAKG